MNQPSTIKYVITIFINHQYQPINHQYQPIINQLRKDHQPAPHSPAHEPTDELPRHLGGRSTGSSLPSYDVRLLGRRPQLRQFVPLERLRVPFQVGEQVSVEIERLGGAPVIFVHGFFSDFRGIFRRVFWGVFWGFIRVSWDLCLGFSRDYCGATPDFFGGGAFEFPGF